MDGVKHGFRQFDHQLRSTVQGVDNHFKQVLNQVDDFGKQLDILVSHQLIVLAEDLRPIAQQIDKGLTKVRDFIYPYRESVLVPVGGPNIDSGSVAYTSKSLDNFISGRQAYVERSEQTRKFSLNGGGEVVTDGNRAASYFSKEVFHETIEHGDEVAVRVEIRQGIEGTPEEVIAERTKDLDLRPHPTVQKQLSPKKLKELKQKLADRTITREEYKQLDWNNRFTRRT